jgi:proline-specific peptidase
MFIPVMLQYQSVLITSLAVLYCVHAAAGQVRDGTVPFIYQGETFQTYYKTYGNIGNHTQPPLVVLHGGAGLVHDYLVPFSDLTANASIPIILYDQLGNGHSTHLRDKHPSFWSIELFMDELANLLAHLEVENKFDLVGHSWGGVLAAEFEVQRQPSGLRHLILTNSLAAKELWDEAAVQLAKTMPEPVVQGLSAGIQNPTQYYPALLAFNAVHGCTVKPLPEEYVYTLDQVFGKNGDPTVANAP